VVKIKQGRNYGADTGGAFDPFGGHKIVRIQNSVTPICLNFQNSVTPIKDQPTRFKRLD